MLLQVVVKNMQVYKKSKISDSENTEEAFFQTLTRTLKKME